MSLDVSLKVLRPVSIFEYNITHNLGQMAKAAGIYECLWRPEEIGITKAEQMIPILLEGLKELECNPDKYKTYNPENGWGSYENLVEFVRSYLNACGMNPEADIEVCR